MKARRMWMGVGATLCLAACGEGAVPDERGPAAVPARSTVVAEGVDEVETSYLRGMRALADNRMLSPAGDNAVEHFLSARAQATDSARARVALAELQPYMLIATEQALARGDAQEASRLQGLIERIDADAPALPRLRAGVAALAREQMAREAQTVSEPANPAPAIVVPAPRPVVPAGSPPATTAAAEPASPPAPTPAMPVAMQEDAGPAVPPPVAAPRGAQGDRAPRLLQDAQPRYPLPALRARIEGQAEVGFTIQPDGSVRDVRLLSSTAGGMFDASALAVAQRWRFEATGRAHASSRTVRFRLPAGDARDG